MSFRQWTRSAPNASGPTQTPTTYTLLSQDEQTEGAADPEPQLVARRASRTMKRGKQSELATIAGDSCDEGDGVSSR